MGDGIGHGFQKARRDGPVRIEIEDAGNSAHFSNRPVGWGPLKDYFVPRVLQADTRSFGVDLRATEKSGARAALQIFMGEMQRVDP
jgi:hypothetical protein